MPRHRQTYTASWSAMAVYAGAMPTSTGSAAST